MPELPEVETIKRALALKLPGRRIVQITIRDPRLRWPVDESRLQQLILEQRIEKISRRAKYLLVHTAAESILIMHLGMSGRLLLLAEKRPLHKHDHVIFNLDNGSELRFRDPRRFGMIDAISPGGETLYPRLKDLGVEPLSTSTKAEALYDRAKLLNRPIKNLLMDANFIVGVGNIYASEALFHAGIHPICPARKLRLADWKKLLDQTRHVLRTAIEKGGTTLKDFVNSDGETGYFQLSLAVYGREDHPCLSCGSNILRIVMVGRSTFVCPKCQKMK